MTINYDCMRDLLLVLESEIKLNEELETNWLNNEQISLLINSEKQKYTMPDIAYATIMLEEAEFIDAEIQYAGNAISDIIYSGITYKGHLYLEKIRPQTVWNEVKGVCRKIGAFSVDIILQVATKVVTNSINQQYGT